MRFLLFLCTFLLLVQPHWASAKAFSTTDKVVNKFMALDYNGSGTVSLREYKSMVMRRLSRRFNQMDKNRDGEISAREYRNFWVNKKSKYYRPRRE